MCKKYYKGVVLPLSFAIFQFCYFQVVIVPHSHNDPGWLHTFEHYFQLETKQILNQIVAKLQQYPDMTFIWSEISFLTAWWDSAHPTKQKVNFVRFRFAIKTRQSIHSRMLSSNFTLKFLLIS